MQPAALLRASGFFFIFVIKTMPKYKGAKISPATAKGKKYSAILPSGKKVNFGASGYRIKPGTPAGDSYCARSAGIANAGDPNAPNYWARQLWSCRGAKSVSKKPFFGKIQLP
jgi:hypothetical protein